MPRENRCQVCFCVKYPDEPGSYCQDCREVVRVIEALNHRHRFSEVVSPAEIEGRQQRIAGHMERVAREMGWT